MENIIDKVIKFAVIQHMNNLMEEYMMSKHIYFKKHEVGSKHCIWSVKSLHDHVHLGWIMYEESWNTWVFLPDHETMWSFDCLQDIVEKLIKLNKE